MKTLYALLILIFICSAMSPACGAPPATDSLRLSNIEMELAAAAVEDESFNKEVDISIGNISLSEMLRNVAKISTANISVKGADGIFVSCNFARAKVVDLIYFLCREYDLDIDVVGNIVSVYPLQLPPPPVRQPNIVYDSLSHTLGYDLAGDKMIDVTKKITTLSGVNMIVPQSMHTGLVSGFVEDMPFDNAIAAMTEMNGMQAYKNDSGIWTFATADAAGDSGRLIGRNRYSEEELSIDSLGFITARLYNGSVQDIIVELCERQNLNYYFLTPLNYSTGVFVRDTDFDSLLEVLLAGTQASYYVENGIYVFGENNSEGKLSSYKIVSLQHRSISNLTDIIPTSLQKNIQIKAFNDLNSLIVSGDQKGVARVANFIESVDKRVPLVTIEIMIVDVKKTDIMEAGIEMGLGNGNKQTSGTLMPGVGMNLSSQSINSLINSFNGFGAVNLGKVTPDFYMNLKFLEDNGNLELNSTPKLSTLNGQEARLKSGETQYYKETTNNYMGTGIGQPTVIENFVWKSVEANLSVMITPFVSQDGNITLDIEIEQTEFTGQISPEAPPATTTRSFKSIIKVENEDMVLLGGIDKYSREKSAKGLPFIARVPVLKWLFGSTKDNETGHKLNVFIKSTITY